MLKVEALYQNIRVPRWLTHLGWQMEGIWFRMANKRVLKKTGDLGW